MRSPPSFQLHHMGLVHSQLPRVEAPYIRVIIIATQSDSTVCYSTRDGGLATSNARARPIDAAKAVTQGHAPGYVSFFPLVSCKECISVASNCDELVFGIGYGVRQNQR
ncbi:hypothetical protein RchiOBHm_Chr5g0016571 [Rosa chinensis]|uniref:Uncharacterized protein n=1 Tax=Rosa chinensis TaxID=74649 RepID=A0A2P6Q6A8_ROSCH|nr:hypothetical protein RchiOBHm_Chr5g0016571 [Rosa chinensis]